MMCDRDGFRVSTLLTQASMDDVNRVHWRGDSLNGNQLAVCNTSPFSYIFPTSVGGFPFHRFPFSATSSSLIEPSYSGSKQ